MNHPQNNNNYQHQPSISIQAIQSNPSKEEKEALSQINEFDYPSHHHQNTNNNNSNNNNENSLTRGISIRRTFSRRSRRSYISNISMINRKNLARFGRSKITFLVVNALFTILGLSLLLLSIFSWAKQFDAAITVIEIRPDLLIMVTVLGVAVTGCGMLGFGGALTHKKKLLTFFLLIIVPSFILNLLVGYFSFRERNGPNFAPRLSQRWDLIDENERILLQNSFKCCGFLSPLDRTVITEGCPAYTNSSNSNSSSSTSNTDVNTATTGSSISTNVTTTTANAITNKKSKRGLRLKKRQDPVVPGQEPVPVTPPGTTTPTVGQPATPNTPTIPTNPAAGTGTTTTGTVTTNTTTTTGTTVRIPGRDPVSNKTVFNPDVTTVQDIPVDQATSIPGCQATWGVSVATFLGSMYIVAFSTIPLYMIAFMVGILSTNHIYD